MKTRRTKLRREKDFLGELPVPAEAYYGIETARAERNFPISGLRSHPMLVRAMALVKKAAAQANRKQGRLSGKRAAAIIRACDEVSRGKFADQFTVDVFQMGAGTSFHMNMNEVLANRAEQILGGDLGKYERVHPNDHVNMGQSTNDVYPTAMRLAAALLMRDLLLPHLRELEEEFLAKGREFEHVVKSGRTHLQDAVPITLGQEFRAYGKALGKCRSFLNRAGESLLELGIGGSAVGTGLNTVPGYRELVVGLLARMTGLDFRPAQDMREAMQSMRPFTEVSAAMRNLAGEMNRIGNDLRLLASGPRTGLGEISLPAVAPGSSIMPGKVNPSMVEMMNMVCYQVMGCDLVVSAASQAGQLELNVMMPVISFNLNLMIEIMGRALHQVRTKCVEGIRANVEKCREYGELSLGIVTALSPRIGYARASEIARAAIARNKTLREIIRERNLLSPEEVDRILDLERAARPFSKRRTARKAGKPGPDPAA
jgi:aspartate ammonia-lyase